MCQFDFWEYVSMNSDAEFNQPYIIWTLTKSFGQTVSATYILQWNVSRYIFFPHEALMPFLGIGVTLNTTVPATRSSFDKNWKVDLFYGGLQFDTTVGDTGNGEPSCIVNDWGIDMNTSDPKPQMSKRHIDCLFPCSGVLNGSG
jgi:hypothetical protein